MAEIRYIISDASKQLDVEPHVLRYWEEELELEIPRNELGHRYFRAEDLNTLKNIKKLKDQGLQLKAIKMLLPGILEEDKLPKHESDQDRTSHELTHGNQVTTVFKQEEKMEVAKPTGSKLQQFQIFLKDVLEDALKENNEELKETLTKEVAGEMRCLFKEREALEERRYKKLDETIREMQKMRQEIASSSSRKLFKFRKNKMG
ncbi:MerR family transcriptional regulator [Vallitalea pronyensis]|uniref:MerR family transcriptional regulator n=1 Tax=Vallitalea pronyensis TaxID=1348613 RepID=A0A8J8MGR1_9FIRM|nr:MerR family transcriptional regulator [Vallitalea pronyensis]QUI21246.1 MerR family transcriptional regulator [Vallitalea pronyensis]